MKGAEKKTAGKSGNKEGLQSSEALNKSVERYRLLIEQMNEGVIFSDEQGILEFVNYAFERITGFSSAGIIGKNAYDLFFDEMERERLKKLILHRKLGESGSYEAKMIHHSGKKIDVRINSTPIFENGEFAGIMSVIADISKERVHREFLEQLQEGLSVSTGKKYFSELTAFLERSFNVKYVMIAVYRQEEDSAETISLRINGNEVSNIKYALRNTPCEQVAGKRICFFPEKVQELFPEDKELADLGAQSYIGIPLFTNAAVPNGLIVMMDDKPIIGIEEKKLLISLLAQRSGNEISRIMAENALAESERKYRKIIESISDVYYQTDLEGNIVMISPSVQYMFGYQPEEIIGKKLTDFYQKPEDREQLLGILGSSGRVNDFETIILDKSGNQVLVSANVGFIQDINGQVVGVQGTVRDVTGKKLDELEREKLILELSNKYNELMQFNYIVSHNLRAPIANLMGLANLLQLDITDSEKQQIFGYVLKATNEMDSLIKDLNAILSTRSSYSEKTETFTMEEIVESVRNNLEKEIKDSGAKLIADIGASTITSIKSYVLSIVYNLTSNAIKYRSPERDPVVRIATYRSDDKFVIEVKDNGIGIDLEKHGKQVFGLYKRFNNAVDGKGLGLYMTKTQVEMMGGTIEIKSAPGEGTSFIVSLKTA